MYKRRVVYEAFKPIDSLYKSNSELTKHQKALKVITNQINISQLRKMRFDRYWLVAVQTPVAKVKIAIRLCS